jgi:hypothetical protein
VPHAGVAVSAQDATVERQRAVGTAGEVELDEHGVVGDLLGGIVQLELEVDGLLDAVAVDAVDADDAACDGVAWGDMSFRTAENGGCSSVPAGTMPMANWAGMHSVKPAALPRRSLAPSSVWISGSGTTVEASRGRRGS